ncbi:hypothetical protein [Ramlibacter sp.]|uniref:hypothetical protein n=1 Tax=Ramlibacter sp. TaxID=1917967 RepID=UPI003D0D3422
MTNRHAADGFDPGRRRFMGQLSGAGLALGAGPLLTACAGDDDAPAFAPPQRAERTYFFNLSKARADSEYFLVAGRDHHRLVRATPGHLQAAAARGVPGAASITHVADAVQLPAAAVQMCYVRGVHGTGPADWHMHSMFMHVPVRGTRGAAAQAALARRTDALGAPRAQAAIDPSSFDDYQDSFDQAVSMICTHPEIAVFDPATVDYIQQNIVANEAATYELAQELDAQGVASATPGGWATLVPSLDENGKPVISATTGQHVCYTQYSSRTMVALGRAMARVMPLVKNDPALGADITNIPAGPERQAALQNKLWVLRKGPAPATAGTAQAMNRPTARRDEDPSGLFTRSNLSDGPGYHMWNVTATGRTVSFLIENWYARYLGLYARFLDAAGNPIELTASSGGTSAFALNNFDPFTSGTYNGYLGLVNSVGVYLGVPYGRFSQTYSVVVPDNAATVRIIAGGLGRGSNLYPDTTHIGTVLTSLMHLALPGIFLCYAAGSAWAEFQGGLETKPALMLNVSQIIVQALFDLGAVLDQDEGLGGYFNLVPKVVIQLITTGLKASGAADRLAASAKEFAAYVKSAIGMGQAEGAAEDALPFGAGLVIQAVIAVGLAAEIIQTSVEVANSPWIYDYELTLTHDLTVTINPDPADAAGFPATATHYQVVATCDGERQPHTSCWLPVSTTGTTRTQPLTYTFSNFPKGGNVVLNALFASDTGWLAGTVEQPPSIPNLVDTATITIKENLVPISAATRYSHKQVSAWDGSKHVWRAGAAPAAGTLSCGNDAGNLCQLGGITLSETFASLGYWWRSASADVRAYGSGATGQLYSFANLSFTQDAQSGYASPPQGFPTAAPVAYDRASTTSAAYYVDTSSGQNIVRCISMSAAGTPPAIDLPGSNRAVGRFSLPSDALLVTQGKIVSFNVAANKMETLSARAPTTDAAAPLSTVTAGPGTREGLIDGPVCATANKEGTIFVLEQGNNRIQAFTTGGNAAPLVQGHGDASTFPLRSYPGGVTYLDLAIDSMGYFFVLARDVQSGVVNMDIYSNVGTYVATTPDVRGGKLAIDTWRNAYLLNTQKLANTAVTEPSVSQWIPSTPPGNYPTGYSLTGVCT